jgi:hypothetical protein
MNCEITFYAPFMGFDAAIRIEFEITHWGSPAIIDYVFGGEPAESPEWEVDAIGLTLSLDDGDGAEWLIDWRSRQFRTLANSSNVEQAIIDDICGIDRPRRGRRGVWDDAA